MQRPEVVQVRRSRATKVLIALAILFVGVIILVNRQRAKEEKWRTEAIKMPERIARLTEETSPPVLAELLQKSNKIRHASTFLEACRGVGIKEVAAGGYELPAQAGPIELARIFKAGPTLVKVTFPEGWTCAKIIDRLQSRGFSQATALRALAYPPGQAVSPLEGRWFPSTYLLPINGSATQLSARLSERFVEIVKSLPKPLPMGADGKRLTSAQVVTLASLVERETSVPSERPLIAGVLLNRLRKGMRLQCDASVQYARVRAQGSGQLADGHKSRLLFRDLTIASPYNTYRVKGLPPGPICNAGEASLVAAAAPKNSQYFFYVMSPKLSRHRFAVDFAAHGRNIRLAKQEAQEAKQ